MRISPELISGLPTNLREQIEAIQRCTGINIITSKEWDPNELNPLPPKALWQILMTKYWLETGIPVGDETVRLFKPDDINLIKDRVIEIRHLNRKPWVSSATWTDPMVWDTQASKPELWKNISVPGRKSTTWDKFSSSLEGERSSRKGLIAKSFIQDPQFKILNIRFQPGSDWKHPEGWSIHIEWYEKTDAREGDQIIPRSFLISSDPKLCVIAGEKTHDYACRFIGSSLPSLINLVNFWSYLHHPPAVFECMRKNGQFIHLNDVSIELPRPTDTMEQYLRNYEEVFVKPLYDGNIPDISNQLLRIEDAKWVTAKEWNIYREARDTLWVNPTINEGNPENSRQRAKKYHQTVIFERSLPSHPPFIQK